jgi:outer membrane protein assembly factor BamB
MRYFFHFLTFAVISLTTSSCGILLDIYESQQDYLSPQHVLEANNKYEVGWNLSDIQVADGFRTPAIVGSPGKIIVEGWRKEDNFSSAFFGLNSNNGEVLWKIIGSNGDSFIVNDNALYRGTVGNATLYAYHTENGELFWATRLPLSHSTMEIYLAENKIFVNTSDSKFFVLNENGEILDDFQISSRTFLVLDGVLYMEDAYTLKAVELSSKQDIWLLEIGKSSTHAPIFDNGEIFLRTRLTPAKIYSIDQYTGKVNWMITQDILSNLCVLGDKIYFTSPDGYLISINRYSGEEISRVMFSPQFDLDKQIGEYYIACDAINNVIAVSFGDNTQIMGLKIINP